MSKTFFQNTWNKIKSIVSLNEHIDIVSAEENIRKGVHLSGPNAYILAFAILIASIGLNVNSIPVIIGAMLISPLMGPIIGFGYSLAINDTDFLRKSAANFMYMVIISLIASTIYFLISPLTLDNPTELLARTNPTIYDVLIAIFGGLAGIIEISNKQKGTVFSGVAIATALMPPLCTAGFGLATWNLTYLIGALYLFFINCVFISLATFVMVKYLKYPVKKFANPVTQRKVHRTISLVTIILIIPSVFSAIITIKENNFDQDAKQFVTANKTLSKAYIYDYSINHHTKPPILEISIAGETLDAVELEMLRKNGESMGIPREQLNIKQNITSERPEFSEQEVVKSIFERNDQEIKKREELILQVQKELKAFKDRELPYEQMAKEVVAQHPEITNFSIARGASIDSKDYKPTEQIIVIIQSDIEITEENIEKLKQWLSIRLDFPNLLIVQDKTKTIEGE